MQLNQSWNTSSGDRKAVTNSYLLQWGPEEDFPEVEGDDPSTKNRLWDLWYSVLHAAKRIPWADEARQGKLLELVRALKARPDPPAPVPLTQPLRRYWIWESGTLWSDLVVLGPSAREAWNDCCGCGAGWMAPEQHAWANVNAFVARLTATNIADFSLYGIWALRPALEELVQYPDAPYPMPLELNLTLAAIWVRIAGQRMFEQQCDDDVPRDSQINIDTRGGFPWSKASDKSQFCTARWYFWRRRFGQEAHNEELSEEVRGLAAESAELIQGLLSNS